MNKDKSIGFCLNKIFEINFRLIVIDNFENEFFRIFIRGGRNVDCIKKRKYLCDFLRVILLKNLCWIEKIWLGVYYDLKNYYLMIFLFGCLLFIELVCFILCFKKFDNRKGMKCLLIWFVIIN